MTEEERMVRTAEAARLVGVHPSTLLEWEKRGLVTSVRPTGTYRRFKVAELMKLRGEATS